MNEPATPLAAGQVWGFHAPKGFETSRLIIGAVVSFSAGRRVFCCAVTQAPERRHHGCIARVTIPFLAITEAALIETVTIRDEAAAAQLPAGFAEALVAWQNDPRGLTCFTVPFDGYLDRMIARQMAAIIGTDAA